MVLEGTSTWPFSKGDLCILCFSPPQNGGPWRHIDGSGLSLQAQQAITEFRGVDSTITSEGSALTDSLAFTTKGPEVEDGAFSTKEISDGSEPWEFGMDMTLSCFFDL